MKQSTLQIDRSSKADGIKADSPPITENFLTPRADISFAGLDEYAIRNKIIESQINELNTKTSEATGKTNDANTEKPKSVIKTRDDKSGQTSKKQGIGFKKVKACFVCKSTDHLIKDCNFHDKKSQVPKLKNVVNTGQKEGKPVWDNTKRVNHQNFSKYPHLSKTFVPSGVLTKTGFVSTARPSISTARPVCTARPNISTARPVYASRPIYPRMDNNLHINFPKDQPNVAGTGPNWMFDLDFLTNSMNYIPVSVENQVNVDAGTQDSYVAGSSGKDKRPTQEYILLPLQPHRTRIPVKDVVQVAQEKPSENASLDKDIQDLEDVIDMK
ncbi:hypothetical protein Tco_1044976 [Tanacetum coccineum]|uniref:Uncharacterized protein n=1 Tax=Tanacetum coccineum TaxID=301880 RepID=A0ABQ5GSR3_9ASTR